MIDGACLTDEANASEDEGRMPSRVNGGVEDKVSRWVDEPSGSNHLQQKVNLSPPSLLGADQQWDWHVERSATPQRLRGKTNDALYRSVGDFLKISILFIGVF
ncbi:hypothetical protein TNCV_2184691 [Trichonephila clavipes]|nr:hypothetical protein TNCV_2184691 [Trichonephila clavipes]